MKLGLAAFLLMISITALSAVGRKPAVEDFVGVEYDTQNVVPTGTETLFNFSKEVKDYQTQPTQPIVRYAQKQSETNAPVSSEGLPIWFGITFVLSLPVITWAVMSLHLKKREAALAAAALPSNVTDLAARRAEKQAEANDDIKKAS